MGEAKRRKQLDPNYGRVSWSHDKSFSAYYTIFDPRDKTYLLRLEETQYSRQTEWSDDDNSLFLGFRFVSQEAATNKAWELLEEKEAGYELIIFKIDCIGMSLYSERVERVKKQSL